MKNIILCTCCFYFYGMQQITAQQNAIFFDDFNAPTLNTTDWSTQLGYGPNINIFRDKQSFRPENIEMGYNSLIQNGVAKLKLLYQPNCYDTWRFPECSESDCHPGSSCDTFSLCSNQSTIQAFYQGGHCLFIVPKHYDYTAGMLFSNQTFKYGTFEIRAKVNKYSNPAFWLAGGCCEEIDIFEFFCNEFHTNNGIHECTDNACQNDNKSCYKATPSISTSYAEDFHVYRLEWTSSYLRFLIDGVQVRYCEESGGNACLYRNVLPLTDNCTQGLNTLFPNGDPMHIIVNVAVDADNCTPLSSSQMEIDYIKVWSDVPPLPPDCNTSSINISGGTSSNPLDLTAPGGVYPQTLRASDFITTSNFMNVTNLQNDPDVYWSAHNYIEINSGFETIDGATFTAEVTPCNSGNRVDSTLSQNQIASVSSQAIQTPVAVKNIKNDNIAFISPNPTSGVFSLSPNGKMTGDIFVYNNLGELVYQQVINETQQIDISSRPKGIYFVKVQCGDKMYTDKLIVQ